MLRSLRVLPVARLSTSSHPDSFSLLHGGHDIDLSPHNREPYHCTYEAATQAFGSAMDDSIFQCLQ